MIEAKNMSEAEAANLRLLSLPQKYKQIEDYTQQRNESKQEHTASFMIASLHKSGDTKSQRAVMADFKQAVSTVMLAVQLRFER
jgi:hypothetical protein